MPRTHIVKEGDGISSIALLYGFSPDRIWNDASNADIRAKRADADILMPGDVLNIPDIDSSPSDCATDQRYRFKRKGVPAYLRLQIFHERKPRANEVFELKLESSTYQGSTDVDGVIEMWVPNDARRGTLYLGTMREAFEVVIGEMDPANELAGVQKRLANLGLFEGEITGEDGEPLQNALRQLQFILKIPITGKPDAETMSRLEHLHDTTELLPPKEETPPSIPA